MTQSALSKKLQIKPAYTILTFGAHDDFVDLLQPLPEGAQIVDRSTKSVDYVHVFARNTTKIAHFAPLALDAVRADGLVWMSYPKRSSGEETDITRDEGWNVVLNAGWRPI